MPIQILKNIVIMLGISLLIPLAAFAGEADKLYKMGQAAAKVGDIDFAFMYFNELDRDYSNSRYREQVLFVKGDYYYQLPGYTEAARIFKIFVHDFPQSKGKLFALAYLYKIAEIRQDKEALEWVKKEILTFQQVGLIFKEFKEYKFRSSSFQNYHVVFRIDNMEFYRGRELFVAISF